MAHEKALREAKKALDLGYSEKEAGKLMKSRGMDPDEVKKELPHIKAQHIVEEHEKAKKAEKKLPEPRAGKQPVEKKSSVLMWLFILVMIALIAYLFYSGVLSLDKFSIKNFK